MSARRANFQAELRGARRVRRMFKAIPDAMRDQLVAALDRGGRLLQAEMQRRAPKKTQALAAGIKDRVLRASLRLRVGLIDTPNGRAKLFYGRIQDLGRKAQVVTVRRRSISTRGGLGRFTGALAGKGPTYKLRVRAMAPKRFITGRITELRTALNRELKGMWNRALAAIGASDD